MRRRSPLNAERLEDRAQPSVFGDPWPNADHLTLSFAPDGTWVAGDGQTQLAGQPSTLFQTMAAAGGPAAWQGEILRAFQTWAVNANINIGVVPDAGNALGSDTAAGGDIRVGAFTTSGDVLSINQPYNVLTGAWAGTVLFNATKPFSVGARDGTFDLFSATLDEAGNVLGLADSTDPTSALYGHYLGARAGLNAADVAAIQSLYGGPRTPDAFEGASGNDTPDTATRLNPQPLPTDPTVSVASAPGADLTTKSDVDFYTLTTDPDTTSLTVRLNVAGKSLLAAKVAVYDDQGKVVDVAAADAPGQDVVLRIPVDKGGESYTVLVQSARADVFGIGRYDLQVGYDFDPAGQPQPAVAPKYVADGGTNETFDTATRLDPVAGSGGARYAFHANLAGQSDVDFYRVQAPAAAAAPMTVVLHPAVPFTVYPRVSVYDGAGNPVPADVVSNAADGRYVVQVSAPVASATYYLKVVSVGRNGGAFAGDYDFTADFTLPSLVGSDVTSGTLTDAQHPSFVTLDVPQSRAFSFDLTAASADPSVEVGLRAIIYNAAGAPVATMTVDAGDTSTATVLLPAGTYYVRFAAMTRNGGPLPEVKYDFRALVVSDPIDPYTPQDPTNPPPPPPDFSTIDQGPGFYLALGLTDPWTDPWQP